MKTYETLRLGVGSALPPDAREAVASHDSGPRVDSTWWLIQFTVAAPARDVRTRFLIISAGGFGTRSRIATA